MLTVYSSLARTCKTHTSSVKGLAVARAGEADLFKMQQLLFIVADGIVGLQPGFSIMRSEFDNCNVICRCSLLLIVIASQRNLHVHVNM